jgi:hypothetical protein
MDTNQTISFVEKQIIESGISINDFFINLLFSLAIIVFGIFLGKIVSYGLNRIIGEKYLKNIRQSFVKLTISIIRWSIYIAFINMAISVLGIPALSKFVGQTLMIVPAFVASLVVLSIGFAIAIYLREIVEDSEVTGWKTFSMYLFYFINLIFGLYALKMALIFFDIVVLQAISIILVIIVGISIAYLFVKKELRNTIQR